MPNHCSNKVIITGTTEAISKIANLMPTNDHGERHFALEHVLPMPEQLNGIIAGSCTIDDEPCECYRNVHKETGVFLYENGFMGFKDAEGNEYKREDAKAVAVSLAEQQQLREAYGAINWYDWNNANWGTKWGFYDVCNVEVEENMISFNADTAWSPASTALAKIAEKYGVDITNHYAECGMGYMGTTVYDAEGRSEDTYAFEGGFWEESDVDYDDEDYEDPELLEEVEEFINEHSMHTGG